MVYDLMRKRRSIRRFKSTVPTREQFEKIISAAIAAPSASNKQPWKFMVVTDRTRIDLAREAVAGEIARLNPQVLPPLREGFSRYAENFTVFAQAPALIVPIYRVFPMLSNLFPEDDTARRTVAGKIESDSALIGVSCAMQNMLLIVEEMGLGGCCMTGPLLAADRLRDIFEVPGGWEIASVVAVGYPDEIPEMPERKGAAFVIKWLD